ncbi:Collagen triple helix repeat [Aphelenchoides avenae]|nr:Collagen triple helix repeat [Aphelenchus avenae]
MRVGDARSLNDHYDHNPVDFIAENVASDQIKEIIRSRPLKVDSDEFRALANEAWSELVGAKTSPQAEQLRARRQTYGEALPKAYPLHNNYAKQDAAVSGPLAMNKAIRALLVRPDQRVAREKMAFRDREANRESPALSALHRPQPSIHTQAAASAHQDHEECKAYQAIQDLLGLKARPGRRAERERTDVLATWVIPASQEITAKQARWVSKGLREETAFAGKKDHLDLREKLDRKRGNDGTPGPNGPTGMRGMPGADGSPGQVGSPGSPGEDAQYCPCPARNAGVDKPTGGYDQAVEKPTTTQQAYGEAKTSAAPYEPEPSAAVIQGSNPYNKKRLV